MLTSIPNLPANVLGFTASGKVTAEDYQSVLVPAIEEKLGKLDRVRLLYVLGKEFEGMSGAAAWEDAKVGLEHLTQFSRVAVVTDVDWIATSVKAFGFAMPCKVRVFGNTELQEATRWICEPPVTGSLKFDFLDQQGILILRPQGELDAADFTHISSQIDPHIEKTGKLEGVMIVASKFPGWDSLSAFFAHLKFVRERQHKIRKLAIVSDDRLLSAMPRIANHLLAPETRHFPMDHEHEALAWVSAG